ncbi:ABC transporter substrate-binding protein [Paenibacillus sp.]|uniref:ABC transporter substrate-binding protein n=1 Tax=Paenibacillus sp. TaxID=58172 RepID=UPI002D5A238E|nr:ABC transporter substrate-binding protein [Paenibacillus sp.]HZG83561.1 ABC transporter substrate-binding protein [Paenibacillus sp.]
MGSDRYGSSIRYRLILLLFGCAAALTGCAAADEAEPPVPPAAKGPVHVLEYWTPFSGGDNRFMTEMVDRFNAEHPEIEVRQTNSRLDDYYQRLRTAILAGNAPDVAIIHQTSLPQFVQNGYIEDVTEPAKRVGLALDGFNPNIREAVMYDGKLYSVPLDTHALVMYYNKSHLAAAGVLDASGKPLLEPGTAGFEAFLSRIRDHVPADVAPMAQPSTRIDSVWLWWSLYNQMEGGGAFYNEDSTAAALDNPKALEALEYVNGLYAKKLIPPDINDAFKLFYEGKAAVLITGMWGTGAFENAPGLDFGVVPVPVLYDRPAVWGDSHTLAIPTKHGMTDGKRDAVLTFARWMVEHGELWAKAGHVPSLAKAARSDAFQALKHRVEFAETADYVAYWPRHVKQWSIIEVLIQQFERMIYGRQTPAEALRNANETIDAELRK